jgi:hypothetical protein
VTYQVRLEPVSSGPTAVIRCVAAPGELARVVPACCGEVWEFARAAGLAAVMTHLGSYGALGGAHTAVREWCREHGRRCAGLNWEVYGHWVDPPAVPRTDVYYLLDSGAQPGT